MVMVHRHIQALFLQEAVVAEVRAEAGQSVGFGDVLVVFREA